MPILSPKRQVTLPKELCDRLEVQPGDDLDILEYKGRITILKKVKGASADGLRTAMTLVAMVNFLTILAFWLLKRRIDVLSASAEKG